MVLAKDGLGLLEISTGLFQAAFGPHLGHIWAAIWPHLAAFGPHSGHIQAAFGPHSDHDAYM